MQMKSMKDFAYSGLPRRSRQPVTVPRAQIEGLLVFTDPGDVHRGDVGVSVDIDI